MHKIFGRSSSPKGYEYGEDADADYSSIVEWQPQLPRRPGAPAMAAMYLKGTDSIGLIRFPPACIDLVRNAINTHWEDDGIKKEIPEPQAQGYIFKMRGWPWVGQHSDSIKIRRLLRSIFADFRALGWGLHMTTNVSNSSSGKDTLVFKQIEAPRESTGTRVWFNVVFSMTSRLRFIDAPEDVIRDLIPILPNMVEHERHPRHIGVHDFELKGKPFNEGYMYSGPSPATPNLVLFLLQFLDDHGCAIYASIRQKQSNGESDGSPDTWHVFRSVA